MLIHTLTHMYTDLNYFHNGGGGSRSSLFPSNLPFLPSLVHSPRCVRKQNDQRKGFYMWHAQHTRNREVKKGEIAKKGVGGVGRLVPLSK